MNIAKAGMTGLVAGSTLAVSGSYTLGKLAKKPVGVPGSIAHIASNPNLDAKGKVKTLADSTKEAIKDTAKITLAAGAVAGTAAIATGCSSTANNIAKEMISKAGNALAKVNISGKNLKEVIKKTTIGEKFTSLPTPAKAAILAGTAVLAAALPFLNSIASAKTGYIEGHNENK